jgi:hypothetical protein
LEKIAYGDFFETLCGVAAAKTVVFAAWHDA